MSDRDHRRPSEITAFLWIGAADINRLRAWLADCAGYVCYHCGHGSVAVVSVRHRSAVAEAQPGNWLVRHAHGLIQSLRHDDFTRKYEAA